MSPFTPGEDELNGKEKPHIMLVTPDLSESNVIPGNPMQSGENYDYSPYLSDVFQSPTQLSSKMTQFHIRTPGSETSPVFANLTYKDFAADDVLDCILDDPREDALGVSSPTFQFASSNLVQMGEDVGKNIANNNLFGTKELQKIRKLRQDQPLSSTLTLPSKSAAESTCKVVKSRKSSKSSKIPGILPTSAKSESLSSSLETEIEEKEESADEMLDSGPFSDLSSRSDAQNKGTENDVFGFLEPFDLLADNPYDMGLGLNLNLDDMYKDISNKGDQIGARTQYKKQDQKPLPEASLRSISKSLEKKNRDKPAGYQNMKTDNRKGLKKSSSFAGLSNALRLMQPSKEQPKFSLSELSTTFPVNSTNTNNFSFVIENNLAALNSEKSKKKSMTKPLDRPALKKASSFMETMSKSTYPSYTPHVAHSHSSGISTPKVLKSMKSGMVLFQLQLNKSQSK